MARFTVCVCFVATSSITRCRLTHECTHSLTLRFSCTRARAISGKGCHAKNFGPKGFGYGATTFSDTGIARADAPPAAPVRVAASAAAASSSSYSAPPPAVANAARAAVNNGGGGSSCGSCGASNQSAKFCSECGKAIVVAAAAAPQAPAPALPSCGKCGAAEQTGKFCSSCGDMIAVGASARPSCVRENYQRSLSCVRL